MSQRIPYSWPALTRLAALIAMFTLLVILYLNGLGSDPISGRNQFRPSYGGAAARSHPENRPQASRILLGPDTFPVPWSENQREPMMTGRSWLSGSCAENLLTGDTGRLQDDFVFGTPKWKVPCNEGHSLPLVFRDNIVLFSGDKAGVKAVARKLVDGEFLWESTFSSLPGDAYHAKGSGASASGVCDGKQMVFFWSQNQQLSATCIDTEGKQRWSRMLGSVNSQWGFNSSPVYFRGLVIQNVDNKHDGFIIAVDIDTGNVVWSQPRPDGFEGSYSSPLLIHDLQGNAIVVVSGLRCITAFNASSGKPVWNMHGVSDVSAATPQYNAGLLVASSGYREHRLGVWRFDQSTVLENAPRELWSISRPSEVPYVPTPLLLNDNLFVVHDDGIVTAYSADNGKRLWRRRLGGAFTASPVSLTQKHILCCAEDGRCFVIDCEDGSVVSQTMLGEPVFASPRIAQNQLLIRTNRSLYCFQ